MSAPQTPTEARAAVESALEAASIRLGVASARLAPPCAFVWPDDPWLEAGQLGGAHRRCHLTIVGLVSKVDDGGNLAAIEGLADSIYLALVAAKLPTPTISGPDPYDAGGITYTAVRARLVLSIGP